MTGAEWRAATVRKIFLNPRLAGLAVYRGEVLHGPDDRPVRGEWEPILTGEQFAAVCAKGAPQAAGGAPSRLKGKGRGSRTSHLLSPFVRCGKCGAKMTAP